MEAVFENQELKAKVTQEAEQYLAPNGVMASNTSTLPITGLAQASKNDKAFIGLHFFSPVDKMQLVEIIKGKNTSAETLAKAYDFVQQIGKRQSLSMIAVASLLVVCLVLLFKKVCDYLQKASIQRVLKWQH
ncbi:3-hydroxyacyl-CoA dehydrogenase family protein [Acinetobacter baumannii]